MSLSLWYYVNILIQLCNGILGMFFPLGFLSLWGQNWPLTPHVQAMLTWYGHANLVIAGFQYFVTTLDAKSQARAGMINMMCAPFTIYACLMAETRGGLVFAIVDYALLAVLLFTSKK